MSPHRDSRVSLPGPPGARPHRPPGPQGLPPPAAHRPGLEGVLLHMAQQQPWLLWLVAALGAWMLSSVSMWLSRFPGQITGVWYTGVWGLMLLLAVPRRHWAGLLSSLCLGLFGANLAFGDSPLTAALQLPPNLVAMLLGVALLERTGVWRRVSAGPSQGLSLLLRGSLLPSLAASVVAVPIFGWQDGASPERIALDWLEGALVGSAPVLPLATVLLTTGREELARAFASAQAWALGLVSLGVAGLAMLHLPFPFVFIALPLTLAAMRVRFAVVAALVCLEATLIGTVIAQGLFVGPPQTAHWQQVLVYAPLLGALLPPLLLAAAVEQSRRQQADLENNSERYRTLYERTPAMMISVDTQGRLLNASRLWLQRMGLQRDEVLGRGWLDFLSPESRERAAGQPWLSLMETGRCRDIELRLLRQDGKPVDVLMSATTERDADGRVVRVHAVLEDITRKRLAEQLAAEHERSKVTLESIADAVITSDARGRILYLNPVAVTMIGLPEAQVRGRLYGDVLRRRDVETGAELPDAVALCLHQRKRQHAGQRVRLDHAHGAEHVVQETVSPMFAADGRLIGAVAVLRDVTEAHALALKLAHRAQHDALTGLPNRLLLHDRLNQGLQLARRTRMPLALMFLDLDRFKAVNDRHGHAAGDALLCQVAERLLRHLRSSDTACRLGGDEFVVLLPQVEQAGDAGDVALHLLEALSAPYMLGLHQVEVSVSIGIATFPGDADDEGTLMRHADAAMYQAKTLGRNRVMFFGRPDPVNPAVPAG